MRSGPALAAGGRARASLALVLLAAGPPAEGYSAVSAITADNAGRSAIDTIGFGPVPGAARQILEAIARMHAAGEYGAEVVEADLAPWAVQVEEWLVVGGGGEVGG